MEPRQITLEVYQGTWDADDKNANFKEDVASCSRIDPMTTLDRLSANFNIPVGALARYILVKWAASGSEGLLEVGPLVVRQMAAMVEEAEKAGTEEARLEAYRSLSQIVSWLKAPLDKPKRGGGQPKG